MKHFLNSTILSTGFAMFSMFFGAGNVVFPLALGQIAQDKTIFAIIGLLFSAVAVPFLGLITMILFDGNYRAFFSRIGEMPGFIVSCIIMGLIGPFGAIPRCISLSHSTLSMFLNEGGISLPLFSFLSCVIIFLFTFRPGRILDLLGYVLTPFLLLSLGIIIIKGLMSTKTLHSSTLGDISSFLFGFKEGYQTMDLLGAFFFSSVVLLGLKNDFEPKSKSDFKRLTLLAIKASLVGAFLLAIIYIGFSFVAAYYSDSLTLVSQDKLIGAIALQVLGPYAGIITSLAVALACLTTAIALTNVFAEFLHKDISKKKLSYFTSLLITLGVTFIISTLDFNGIVKFLSPILQVFYPSLILLTLLNLLYKLYGITLVKGPVLALFFLTLIIEMYPLFTSLF